MNPNGWSILSYLKERGSSHGQIIGLEVSKPTFETQELLHVRVSCQYLLQLLEGQW